MQLDKKYRIILIIILFFALVMVRAFATTLFYDPFIEYFRYDYLYETVPVFSGSKLLINLFFRYALNSIISLIIIYLAFKSRNFVLFSIKFYIIAFVVLTITFFIILKGELAQGYLFAFYVRRFIIHPLFVLILLPAFYYKQHTSNLII